MSGAGNSFNSAEYAPYADTAAAHFGIPTQIFQSLIQTESSWNPTANSSAGAIGLTQLMPSTAAQLGVNPYDPQQNIAGGADYLSQLYGQFGNWQDALAAYNAGPGNIGAGQGYAQKVLSGAQQLGYSPDGNTYSPNPVGSAGTTGTGSAGSTSASPSWLQSILGIAGLGDFSLTNIIVYAVAIIALAMVSYFGIKSLFGGEGEAIKRNV